MCPLGLFQKKTNPYTQLTERMTHYKSLYTPIITNVKNDVEKKRLEGSSPQFVPQGREASNQGTYFKTDVTEQGKAGWTAKWAPLVVHNKETDSLALGAALKSVINSQHSDQDRKYVVNRKGKRIDLFSLDYSSDKISLHVQKHEFCRELRTWLVEATVKENSKPSPHDLKQILEELTQKYPLALDGQTKKIVNQLKNEAKKAYPDDHALDEPTLGDKIKQGFRGLKR